MVNKAVEKAVQERLKQSGYTPPSGDDTKNKFSIADLDEDMPIEEINKIWDKLE